jgi:hypothetical protein
MAALCGKHRRAGKIQDKDYYRGGSVVAPYQ